MKELLEIPLEHRGVGVFGPVITRELLPQALLYLVQFRKDSTWPQELTEVFSVEVELSVDHGRTWRHDTSIGFDGGPWVERQSGAPTDLVPWTITAPDTDGPGQFLRFTVRIKRPCAFGFRVVCT